eukprot:2061533-Rhodomonas_salina.1
MRRSECCPPDLYAFRFSLPSRARLQYRTLRRVRVGTYRGLSTGHRMGCERRQIRPYATLVPDIA